MQMHCSASSKSLAQRVAKMSNPWWYKPEHPWQSWESWTAWQPSTWTTWESQYENTRTTWEDDEDDEWTTQNTHSQPTSSRAHSRPRRVQVTSEQRTSETSRPTPAPNHSGDISQDRPILLKNNWANQDSHSRSHQQAHGRKAAYIAQQALRQYCLESRSWLRIPDAR